MNFSNMTWRGNTLKEWLWLIGPWLLALSGALVVTVFFWRPAPPRTIVLATGQEGSAAQRVGERYKEFLAIRGIDVELRTTKGALENRALLLDDDDTRVVAALVQSGVASPEDAEWISAVAMLYPEPLWVFYRSNMNLMQPDQFKGQHIAVGALGSGTRRVMLALLRAYGVEYDPELHLDMPFVEAVEALRTGKVNVMAMVSNEDSDLLQSLLRDPTVRLMTFPQSTAISRLLPQFSTAMLSAGIVDLVATKPTQDLPLLATQAQLLVRNTLHPALIRILAEAAREIHNGAGWFNDAHTFPNLRGADLPIDADAERFFTSGLPFLHRYFPFWVAVWLERVLIIALPLLGFGIPAARFIPVIYTWRMRSRIYRWYAEIRQIDALLMAPVIADNERHALVSRLNDIDAKATAINVPLAFAGELFSLKEHLLFLKKRLEASPD